MKVICASVFLLAALAMTPCAAQESVNELAPVAAPKATKPAAKPSAAPAAPVVLPDPPYQKRMERLSEILGALHYLRPLCVKGEDQSWRQLMLNLLEAENPTTSARERMIAAFNQTYRGFHENYRKCTPSARLAGRRYRDEGVKLSRDLTSHFTD